MRIVVHVNLIITNVLMETDSGKAKTLIAKNGDSLFVRMPGTPIRS